MAKAWVLAIALLFVTHLGPANVCWAGDEDTKLEKKKAEPKEPDAKPLPEDPESTEMSLPEEKSPEFSLPAAPKKKRKGPWDPDANIDYAELLALAEPADGSEQVLPPALGSTGYRPNLIAVSVRDRTPGFGVIVEYSWNRLGVGGFFSYKDIKDSNFQEAYYQNVGGLYMIYRWLPWSFSPYLLAGVEAASNTNDTLGGNLGLGVEVRVYYGWTVLLGYTYHSTVRKGTMGGAFGWAF